MERDVLDNYFHWLVSLFCVSASDSPIATLEPNEDERVIIEIDWTNEPSAFGCHEEENWIWIWWWLKDIIIIFVLSHI